MQRTSQGPPRRQAEEAPYHGSDSHEAPQPSYADAQRGPESREDPLACARGFIAAIALLFIVLPLAAFLIEATVDRIPLLVIAVFAVLVFLRAGKVMAR